LQLTRKFRAPNGLETRSTLKLSVTCDDKWFGTTCKRFCSPSDNKQCVAAADTSSNTSLDLQRSLLVRDGDGREIVRGRLADDERERAVRRARLRVGMRRRRQRPLRRAQRLQVRTPYSNRNPSCSCRSGWHGADCGECVAYPHCAHGSCNLPGECICDTAYGGALCSVDLDYCAHHAPCQNAAVCVSGKPCAANQLCEYRCECASGWTGKDCHVPVSTCAESPCENAGECRARANGTFVCECPHGFAGLFCETKTISVKTDFKPHHRESAAHQSRHTKLLHL